MNTDAETIHLLVKALERASKSNSILTATNSSLVGQVARMKADLDDVRNTNLLLQRDHRVLEKLLEERHNA